MFLLQKTSKTKNVKKNCEKFFETFSQIFNFGKSHGVEKNISGHLCSQNALFLQKIEEVSLGFEKKI